MSEQDIRYFPLAILSIIDERRYRKLPCSVSSLSYIAVSPLIRCNQSSPSSIYRHSYHHCYHYSTSVLLSDFLIFSRKKMAPACGVCNSTTAQWCKQCHSITYCSRQCQQSDWPSHKLLCSQYSYHQERPSPLHRRAILFQDSSPQPKFVWIECKETVEEYHTWEEPQNVNDYMGPETLIERTSYKYNKVRGRPLVHSIEIHNRNAFSMDGSILNQSIRAVTRGDYLHEWCGPVVVLRKNGNSTAYAGSFGDMGMEDYLHVVDHFKTYY